MRVPLFLFRSFGSSAEVIKTNIGIVHSEGVQEIQYRFCHHRRTAEVVLDVLGSVMLLEVGVAHHRSDEARGVLDTELVCLRVRTVERQVEMEDVRRRNSASDGRGSCGSSTCA